MSSPKAYRSRDSRAFVTLLCLLGAALAQVPFLDGQYGYVITDVCNTGSNLSADALFPAGAWQLGAPQSFIIVLLSNADGSFPRYVANATNVRLLSGFSLSARSCSSL